MLVKFNAEKIRHVIRLNDRLYDEEVFTQEGIQVHDLEFPDGTCPDRVTISLIIPLQTTIEAFIKVVENARINK